MDHTKSLHLTKNTKPRTRCRAATGMHMQQDRMKKVLEASTEETKRMRKTLSMAKPLRYVNNSMDKMAYFRIGEMYLIGLEFVSPSILYIKEDS
ncbi:hypothetical protein HAX54_015309 [Datura stramonium]|uniref:Uncharacterized protein n=1 Tax=Datura stramonium TaxID=4076 RepID=A0ABS8TSJ5_DATST|nr:hypothetical protein [Datura stramonium]